MPGTDRSAGAGLPTLEKRAELLRRIRSFFYRHGVMEVDTPLLGECGVTDLHIDCIEATVDGERRYLQSSPEYFMKRLLARHGVAIYSLGKVFRDGESGKRHRPEFTLLEWYRPGWDEFELMAEVGALIDYLYPGALQRRTFSYRDIFHQVTGIDPHAAEVAVLAACAGHRFGGDWRAENRATLLDLFFSQAVEPALPAGLVFVHDYPACQAALARLHSDAAGTPVARRFEVFLNGVELGNGYYELTDAVEQRKRFEADIALRKSAGKKPMAADEALLAALEQGLPDCAGVAIGVDRLLMQLLGSEDIGEVVPFG